MSAAELSDVQLDQLLGQVRPPPPPAADLADRIAARALRTPQAPASRFALPRRHGPRRRPAVWTVVIAANLMAAAAAAASWDGQQFDFHRLTDLPHRVITAIHRHRHGNAHELIAREHARVPPNTLPSLPAVVSGSAKSSSAVAVPAPAKVVPAVHAPPHPPLLAGRIERPRTVHAQTASARAARPFQLLRQVAVSRGHGRQIATIEPTQSAASAPAVAQQHRTESLEATHLAQEQSDRSAAFGERRQPIPEAGTPAQRLDNVPQASQTWDGTDQRQGKFRARQRRWRPFFKRAHPGERGNRFRGRF